MPLDQGEDHRIAESRAAMCEGKKGFDTPQLAHRVASRSRDYELQAFRCVFCGLWHLGTPQPKRPKRERTIYKPKGKRK